MLWENLRADEFPAAIEKSGGLCVMVLGCLEKHGPHLPVGTDSLKGDGIARMACEKAGVVMFPTTMWLGDVVGMHAANDVDKTGHYGFIAMNPHTLLTVLEELCDEIARNGFRKILLLESHGGNGPLISYFLRCQTYNRKNYATMSTKCYNFADISAQKILDAAAKNPEYFSMLTEEDYKALKYHASLPAEGGHGCFRETGLVYGTTPELVAPERFELENGISTHVADYLFELGIDHGTAWGQNYPDSYAGYPSTGCSKTIGEAMVKMSVDRLVHTLEVLKTDERCVEFSKGLFGKK